MIKKIYNFIKKEKLNDFDLVYKTLFKKEKLVIFDVGANFGQSLKRYKSYLNIQNYYSFEPLKECYDFIIKNYNEPHYHHYNLAIGKNIESKIFYVNNT